MYLRPMTASEVKQWYDRELTRAFPPGGGSNIKDKERISYACI